MVPHIANPEVDMFGDSIRREYYLHIHTLLNGQREPRWRGVRVVKFPSDMILYAQVIHKRKPNWIIETGTAYGGSGLFFADMMDLFGGDGGVITIDVKPRGIFKDKKESRSPDGKNWETLLGEKKNLTQLIGSSVDPKIMAKVKEMVGSKKVMVVLDSDHSEIHVHRELTAYGPIVTPGQYMVVEDCWTHRKDPYSPLRATNKYLDKHPEFARVNIEKQFIFAVTKDGWLLKR
jgi:cephalosporin hydroxylase